MYKNVNYWRGNRSWCKRMTILTIFCQRASSHSPHSKVVYIWKKSHYTSTFWQFCCLSFLRCKYMPTQQKFRSQFFLEIFWEGILRKNCCSFGFCPNYLPPPPLPPIWTTSTTFFPMSEFKIWKSVEDWKYYISNMISYHVFQFGNLLNIGLMVTMATIR